MLAEISGIKGVSSEIDEDEAISNVENKVKIVRLDIRASNRCRYYKEQQYNCNYK